MFMSSTRTHIGAAIVLVVALGSAALNAQGNSGKSAVQPVGTMQIASLGGTTSPIYDFSFSVSNPSTPGTGGGSGAGKPSLTAVAVARLPDGSSPLLFRNALLGTHLQTVQFTVFGAGKSSQEAMYVLNDAQVSGFSSADGVEHVAFTYRSIEVLVGGAQFCFDVTTNGPC